MHGFYLREPKRRSCAGKKRSLAITSLRGVCIESIEYIEYIEYIEGYESTFFDDNAIEGYGLKNQIEGYVKKGSRRSPSSV